MGQISFARGVPSPDCLPIAELSECAQAALERDGATVLNYGPVSGYGLLREWVGERHGVDPGRVLLTNGSLQGLALLAETLAGGGRVLTEAPTYDRPLKLLPMLGVEVCALDDLELLERSLPAAFLYVIPTFQNPSGRTMPLDERRALVETAQSRGLLIVEDDPYGLVRFEGDPLPTLFELAGGEGVVYASSFSKTVAPGLRVGYLVLPPELVPALQARAVQTYLTPALLPQATVHEFVTRGLLEPAVARVCALLRERRDALLAALAQSFPDEASWNRPEGGYFLWVDLPRGTDAGALLKRAEAAGVTFVAGSDFFAGRGGEESARLAYSFVAVGDIAAGVGRLAELLLPAAAAV